MVKTKSDLKPHPEYNSSGLKTSELFMKRWYNTNMYNWNVDLVKVNKNGEKFILWKLNQLINFGLNGEKISSKLVKKYWNKLTLDPKRKKFLQLLLWQKPY